MSKYILSVDQSTVSTKAFIFDANANCIGSFSIGHTQIYPKTGWVEHNLDEIYLNVKKAIEGVIKSSKLNHKDIACISITNQRETTAIFDESGPLYNAIVWQCPRALEITERESIKEKEEYILQSTGLKLSPYFSAAKASWIVENIKPTKKAYFGTIDSWLIFKLTGKHITDYSNASRTQLFNIKTLSWDEELINLFGLKNLSFPEVSYSDKIFGYTDVDGILEHKVPIAGVMGDSHAALFAKKCWEKGQGKATLGTGSSIMLNIGDTPTISNVGLSTSIAWGMCEKVEYVFEGNVNCSGDTINWLRDELGIIDDNNKIEEYISKTNSSDGVYLVPAFVGLGTPYWRSDVKAVISGLSRNSNKYHIIRAGIESIAYQVKDIMLLMQQEADLKLSDLFVDGGSTVNEFLLQFLADLLDMRIITSKFDALSALGAAFASGLATGVWTSRKDLLPLWQTDKIFKCRASSIETERMYKGWIKAVSMALS